MKNKRLVFLLLHLRFYLTLVCLLQLFWLLRRNEWVRTTLSYCHTCTYDRTKIIFFLLALFYLLVFLIFRSCNIRQKYGQGIRLSAFTITSWIIFPRSWLILIRCPKTFFTLWIQPPTLFIPLFVLVLPLILINKKWRCFSFHRFFSILLNHLVKLVQIRPFLPPFYINKNLLNFRILESRRLWKCLR